MQCLCPSRRRVDAVALELYKLDSTVRDVGRMSISQEVAYICYAIKCVCTYWVAGLTDWLTTNRLGDKHCSTFCLRVTINQVQYTCLTTSSLNLFAAVSRQQPAWWWPLPDMFGHWRIVPSSRSGVFYRNSSLPLILSLCRCVWLSASWWLGDIDKWDIFASYTLLSRGPSLAIRNGSTRHAWHCCGLHVWLGDQDRTVAVEPLSTKAKAVLKLDVIDVSQCNEVKLHRLPVLYRRV